MSKRECDRRYYERHKEEINEQRRQYRLAHLAEEREKDRKRYEKNPDKFKARMARWREVNLEDRREYDRGWYQANLERAKETQRKWREANAEKVASDRRAWAEANPERMRKAKAKWAQANPEYARAKEQRRRAQKMGAPSDFTAEQWDDILAKSDYRCAYCGVRFSEKTRPTQDHVIPLSKGGPHTASNIVPACRSCNCRKGAKIISA